MADGVISYEDAIGAAPVPAAAVSAPASAPAGDAPSDMASYADRPLTVHARAPSAPTAPVPDAPPTASVAPAASGIISYEDATTPATPNPGGVLSNAADDSYVSSGLKGLGTTVIKGLAHIPGVAGDAMDFADYLVARAQAKITGRPLADILEEQKKASSADGFLDPRNWVPAGPTLSDPVLKQTGEYAATTEPGKILMSSGEALLGGLVGGVGVAPMVMNAAAGALGQGVTDLTDDPLLGAVAGIGGGALAHGGAAAVKKIAAPALMGVPGIDNVPVIGPAVSAARDNRAAGAVLAEATDPGAVKAWAAQPAADPTVPNSPQTLAGAVGNDMGLYQAEKAARNVDNTPFNLVDKAQSTAAQAAIPVPGQQGADVFRPGQMIRQRLDAIDAAAEAAQDRLAAAHQDAVTSRQMATQSFADQQRADLLDRTIARGQASGDAKAQSDAARQAAHDRLVGVFQDANARAAQTSVDAAAPLRDLPTPEAAGVAFRAAQQEATNAVEQAKRRAYNTIDPDGTLTTVVSPLRDAKRQIQASIDPHGGVQPTGAEAKLWIDIDRLPDVIPFRSLQKIDSRVTAAMADARRNPNPEDPEAISRLTQLKSATMDAIHNGIENQAAHEARLVQDRMMPAELSLESRMRDFDGLEQAEAIGGRATGTDSGVGFFPGARPLVSRGAGQAPTPSLPPAGRAPQSLVAFVRANGGIKEFGGELGARELHKQFPGIVNNRSGMSLDMMREAAAEAGYLGADTAHAVSNTDVNDFLHAIDNHPVYSVHDYGRVMDRENNATLRDMQRSYKSAAGEIRDNLRAAGVDPKSAPPELLHDASVLMTHERLSWREALDAAQEQGIFNETENAREAQQRASQEQGYRTSSDGDAGAGRGAAGASAPSGDQFGIPGESRPNWDQGAADRLGEAKAAHVQFQQDHKNPTVAPVLKTNGFAGQYLMPDGAIPSKIAVKGGQGFETANRFLTAAGGDPRAVSAMQASVLAPLAKTMPPVGNVHPNALSRWKQDYDGTLRALDAVSPGFSSRFDNAAAATQVVLDGAIEQRQALASSQREAARQAFIENAARRDQLGQATAADRAQVASLLAERASDDRAAIGQSKAQTAEGIAQAKGIARNAHATPAGQFLAQGGDRIASTEVENAVGSMLKTGTQGATRMRSFVGSLGKDPDALAGVQKAGTDWMVRHFQNADGTMSGAKFIDFVRDNKDVLKELYPTSQVSMFGAIADRIRSDAMWRTETAQKAGPGTAKDLLKALEANSKNGAKHTSMAVIAIEAMREGFDRDSFRGASVAGAGAATAYLLGSLRSAGIKSVAQLYQTMLADPEKARYLISKMPETPEGGKLRALTGSLRRSLLVGQEQSQRLTREQERNKAR